MFLEKTWNYLRNIRTITLCHKAVRRKRSHAPTLTITQMKCDLKVSLGDNQFTE